MMRIQPPEILFKLKTADGALRLVVAEDNRYVFYHYDAYKHPR